MEQGNNGCISVITQPSVNNESNGTAKVKSTAGMIANSTSRIKMVQQKLRIPLCANDDPPVELAKKCLAEFLGTAILVGLGCMGCVGTLDVIPPSIQPAFTFGLAVTIVVTAIAQISGAHINPCVTVASVVCGKKSLLGAVCYIISQVLGSIFGYGLLKAITPTFGDDKNFCMTLIHRDLSLHQGFWAEVFATSILVFMVCATMDPRNDQNTDSVAIKIGLGVVGLCLAFGPYTGCSMNPARSLGPSLLNQNWKNHWVFWVGPTTGALLASILYQFVFMPSKSRGVSQSA